MKRFLFLLPLVSLLFLAACSDSEDEVAKNFTVKVLLTADDGIALSNVNDLVVTAVNLTTSKEQTATPANGTASFSLPTGKYNFSVT